MFQKLHAIHWLSLCRKFVWISLLSYSVLTTVLLLKLKPEPILIGVDNYGTRIIKTADDRLVKQEKENFLKRVLVLQYNYDSENFEKRIQEAGDLMSKELWENKAGEFKKIIDGLKTESVVQKAVIQDLREIDSNYYQADLLVEISRKLSKTTIKLRIDLRLKPNKRSAQNPYPYEVESYDEQIAS